MLLEKRLEVDLTNFPVLKKNRLKAIERSFDEFCVKLEKRLKIGLTNFFCETTENVES